MTRSYAIIFGVLSGSLLYAVGFEWMGISTFVAVLVVLMSMKSE